MDLRTAKENIKWYKGEDLFALGWIGPYFRDRDPQSAKKMAELKRVFQEHNLIKELVDNWKDGLISEPFTWYLKGKDGTRIKAEAGEESAASEAEIALQRWLDWINQQAIAADPAATNFESSDIWTEFILSLGVTGEGNLRLWQPERFADDPDPIHQIHLHSPKVGSIEVQRGDDGFTDSISYTYGENQKEIQKLGDQGKIVVVMQSDDQALADPLTVDTAGQWLIQQVRKPPVLTSGSKKKQSSVCHALTMKLRNQEIGGFKERTLLNAEFPEAAVERGPGIDNYVYGIPTGDPANPTYATPQIHESQPTEVKTFIDSIQIDRVLLYLEHKQGHLLAVGDDGLSGESRIQMRQGFELHLKGWKRPIESAIANILNIVLRVLGYTDLEAVVELKITTGKLSAEERDAIIKEFAAGLLPRAIAMEKLGTVSDVDAAVALLDEELKEQTDRRSPISDPFELGDNNNGAGNNTGNNGNGNGNTGDPAPAAA